MKCDFNMLAFLRGLRGQVHVYGRFDSKKKAVETLEMSLHHFNKYASIGSLGVVGEALVDLYPVNTLLATHHDIRPAMLIDDKIIIVKIFEYWVHKGGKKWESRTYLPPIENQDKGASKHV